MAWEDVGIFLLIVMRKLCVVLVICLLVFAVLVRQSEATLQSQRTAVVNWLWNSGVITSTNEVKSGVNWNGVAWAVNSGERFDAQAEVAMALMYHYKLSSATQYRTKALDLLHKAIQNARNWNNGEHYFPTWQGPSPGTPGACYTQDNGRAMRSFALAYKETADSAVQSYLQELADFWVVTIPANGGVGVGKYCMRTGFDDISPGTHRYPSARHIGELLTGMVWAYDALGASSYREASKKLGNWLVVNQAANGSWWVPNRSQPFYNGGLGNRAEATALSLRGLSLLYKITANQTYATAATRAYQWVLNESVETDNRWHRGRLLTERHRSADYRYFNTLYLQEITALVDYFDHVSGDSSVMALALEVINFMTVNMAMHGSTVVEGGILGEWDLATNARSTFVDDEYMTWGNWLYTGWTNAETVEGIALYELAGGGPPPPPTEATVTLTTMAWDGTSFLVAPNVAVSVKQAVTILATWTTNATGKYVGTLATGSYVFSGTYQGKTANQTLSITDSTPRSVSLVFQLSDIPPPPPGIDLMVVAGITIGGVSVGGFWFFMRRPRLVKKRVRKKK